MVKDIVLAEVIVLQSGCHCGRIYSEEAIQNIARENGWILRRIGSELCAVAELPLTRSQIVKIKRIKYV